MLIKPREGSGISAGLTRGFIEQTSFPFRLTCRFSLWGSSLCSSKCLHQFTLFSVFCLFLKSEGSFNSAWPHRDFYLVFRIFTVENEKLTSTLNPVVEKVISSNTTPQKSCFTGTLDNMAKHSITMFFILADDYNHHNIIYSSLFETVFFLLTIPLGFHLTGSDCEKWNCLQTEKYY